MFACRAKLLRETGSRIGGRVEIVGNSRVVDIDTAADLEDAEALMLRRAVRPMGLVHDEMRLVM